MKYLLAALLLLSVPALSSCRAMQVSDARADLQARLDPLLGRSKEEVILAVGAPRRTSELASMEVWEYYQSYGTRSNGYANTNLNADPNAPYYSANANTYGSTQSWEAYDRYTLYFDSSGVLQKWDGYVQR
jgi:hypothetical protein